MFPETDSEIDAMAARTARTLVTDLVLRSILLKLNSEKANCALHEQIRDQLFAVSKDILEAELIAAYDVLPPSASKEVYDDMLRKSFARVAHYGQAILDGLFEKPTDIAGIF